jgi:hypothetical protein
VLRIRRVYPESRIRFFSIPDLGSEFFPSRIRIKEFKYLNPKKWFLSVSSRKNDPGCSSRIRILTFLSIPDPGSRCQKGTGSRIRNTEKCKMKDQDPGSLNVKKGSGLIRMYAARYTCVSGGTSSSPNCGTNSSAPTLRLYFGTNSEALMLNAPSLCQ